MRRDERAGIDQPGRITLLENDADKFDRAYDGMGQRLTDLDEKFGKKLDGLDEKFDQKLSRMNLGMLATFTSTFTAIILFVADLVLRK